MYPHVSLYLWQRAESIERDNRLMSFGAPILHSSALLRPLLPSIVGGRHPTDLDSEVRPTMAVRARLA